MNQGRRFDTTALRHELFRCSLGLAVAGTGLIAVYLYILLRLDASEGHTLLALVAVLLPIEFSAVTAVNRALQRPFVHALERGEAATRDELRDGFRAVVDYPRRSFLIHQLWWLLGAGLVALGMERLSPNFRVADGLVLVAATVSGGLITQVFHSLLLKQVLARARAELAQRLGSPEEREACGVPRLPLIWKLWTTLIGLSVIPVVFVLLLVETRAPLPLEEWVLGAQQALLERSLASDAKGASLAREAEQAEALGFVRGRAELDPRTGAVVAGDPSTVGPEERAWIVRAQRPSGTSARWRGEHLFSWRRIPATGRLAVVSIPRSAFMRPFRGLPVLVGLLLAFGVAIAFVAAWLMARDLGGAVVWLREVASRIAQGDLRRFEVFESEDEFGDVGRAVERMAQRLRETVVQVGATTESVEGAAREMAEVGEGVAAVTLDQVEGLRQAKEGVAGVVEQMESITESARALSVSVEESSSSVLELGAAAEQLSQTASVFSEKVEEVASSVEEAVRSVDEVAHSADGLAQAASDTSVSMEEMASSMREVDANAAETAQWSARVVSVAERGREQVEATIAGMEAIRDATREAQEVMQGLGERARAIGAVIDVIDEVADETNLLALNAAIIAAQAGEHGRAFSVVADEIKDLAERVLSSTKEIGSLVNAVQEESSRAVAAVERGAKSVAEGVERSAQAGVSLQEITEVARSSGERMEEIVRAVREQTRAAEHVAELMEHVREGVEAIRRASQEQARGNQLVLAGVATMREGARQVDRTTHEQARGGTQIREGIEAVREAVEAIHEALRAQSKASQGAVQFVEQVFERTRNNEEAARRLQEAARSLHGQAEALRSQIERFRL